MRPKRNLTRSGRYWMHCASCYFETIEPRTVCPFDVVSADLREDGPCQMGLLIISRPRRPSRQAIRGTPPPSGEGDGVVFNHCVGEQLFAHRLEVGLGLGFVAGFDL